MSSHRLEKESAHPQHHPLFQFQRCGLFRAFTPFLSSSNPNCICKRQHSRIDLASRRKFFYPCISWVCRICNAPAGVRSYQKRAETQGEGQGWRWILRGRGTWMIEQGFGVGDTCHRGLWFWLSRCCRQLDKRYAHPTEVFSDRWRYEAMLAIWPKNSGSIA